MTEEIKKLIESVERYDWEEGRMLKDKTGIYIEFDELLWIVGELTKWNRVENGLPENSLEQVWIKGVYEHPKYGELPFYGVSRWTGVWRGYTDCTDPKYKITEWKYII